MPRDKYQLGPGTVLGEESGGTGVDATDAPQGSIIKGTGSGLELADARLFAASATASVTNTVAETTIVAAGVGTKILQANALAVGRMLRWIFSGYMATAAVPGTLTLRTKLNTTLITATAAGTPVASQNNLFWRITGILMCRAVGILTGSVIAQGAFENKAVATNVAALNAWDMTNTAPIIVNTTIAQTFEATVQWGTADAANAFNCTNFLLELL